jgi:hypothetical protein
METTATSIAFGQAVELGTDIDTESVDWALVPVSFCVALCQRMQLGQPAFATSADAPITIALSEAAAFRALHTRAVKQLPTSDVSTRPHSSGSHVPLGVFEPLNTVAKFIPERPAAYSRQHSLNRNHFAGDIRPIPPLPRRRPSFDRLGDEGIPTGTTVTRMYPFFTPGATCIITRSSG